MSDDLSAFFAKKKDKKKKTAVKIEEVGQALERRAKRQEEYEHEQEEMPEKRVEEEKAQSQGEESEWIEYGESQGRLEGLRIKDMGLESEQDQVNNEEPEDREVHETKTWGQVSNEKKATSDEPEQAVTISDKAMAAAYKPPALRKTTGGVYRPRGPAANFDMSSDAAFPSLADASKIEKVKKEEGKGTGGWVKAGGGSGSSSGPSSSGPPRSYTTISGSGREAALAAAKSMMSSTGPAPTRASAAEPTPAPAASAAPAAPKAGSYVPPHLRKQ